MSKVYVVEMPMRWDRERRQLVPARDLSDAERFGEVVHLMPPGADVGIDMPATVLKLREGLSCFTRDDYLVAGMGHPLSLAAAVALAAHRTGGHVRLLHWVREDGAYREETMSLREFQAQTA